MAPITRSQTRAASTPIGIRKNTRTKRPRKVHPRILGAFYPQSSYQSSPLLMLPPEIRLMIWTYVLTSPTGYLHYSSVAPYYSISSPWNFPSQANRYITSLLLTCHQICHETLHLPFKLNTIVFHTDWEHFIWLQGIKRRDYAIGDGLNMDIPSVERWANFGEGTEIVWSQKRRGGQLSTSGGSKEKVGG